MLNEDIVCGLCAEEVPADTSLRDYQKWIVGWTEVGVLIWCIRHECVVAHAVGLAGMLVDLRPDIRTLKLSNLEKAARAGARPKATKTKKRPPRRPNPDNRQGPPQDG